MGLDISAYSKLKFVERVAGVEEWEDRFDWTKTVYIWPSYVNDFYFSEWADGLIANGVYKIGEGKISFRAGSYSSYNQWREWLCRLVLDVAPRHVWENTDEYLSAPFYRLINFSDCEGFISEKWGKGLAGDFQTYQEMIDEGYCESSYKKQYANWRRAFELAADGGLVQFS